jgi:hypothetical protein
MFFLIRKEKQLVENEVHGEDLFLVSDVLSKTRYMISRIFSLLILISAGSSFCFQLQAQISGQVKNEEGMPLPYASIYSKGSTQGTTSNENGYYFLDLPEGRHEIVAQYIGYETLITVVNLQREALALDLTLKPQAIDLLEVVVRASEEDPAYPIIRKAMEKRLYYLNQVNSYSCNSYVKGNIKFEEVPDKFMGVEIGDMEGMLDTSGQGIIYLSETESQLYYQRPDKFKEVLVSSRVSGNDQGFGFNRASDLDFNLYETQTTIGRPILSPIAPGAFGYYRYRLIGSFPDASGRLLYKIQVLPKRTEDPVYSGFVYILADLWVIQQAELGLSAGAIKQPGLDSMRIVQVNVPVQEPDVWRTFSQHLEFTGGIFGFEIRGTFTGVFSEFQLDPDLPGSFFNREVFAATEEALTRDSLYWTSIRPIPLTREEQSDYVKKDSLQRIWTSKPYLDSLDREANKFGIMNLVGGYTWKNSWKKESFSIPSPLSTLQFNTVQGWNAQVELRYNKAIEKQKLQDFEARVAINYGFEENIWRPVFGLSYRFNEINRTRLSLSGGRELRQFNSDNPITASMNAAYSLLGRRNYAKWYDSRFVSLALRSEPLNGILINTSLEYSRRNPVFNTSNFSYRKKENPAYTANHPLLEDAFDQPIFDSHEAFIWDVQLTLRLKQQYALYPKRKVNYPSELPEVLIHYQKGIPIAGTESDFDKIGLGLRQSDLSLGIVGNSHFQVSWHKFLRKGYLPFMDYQHINGNQTFWIAPEQLHTSFRLLPYYTYSTSDQVLEAHFEHNFRGFIFDKLPLLRKTGLYLLGGAGYLYTPERGHYQEYYFGLDRLGVGILRLLRLDLVAGKGKTDASWNYGWRISLSRGG